MKLKQATSGANIPPSVTPGKKILEVKDLSVVFNSSAGAVHAVNGVSFDLFTGETLVILGESGSGKSVTAAAIMNILETPPATITGGRILYNDTDLLRLSSDERRKLNGPTISLVFQDALIALNPVYTVGWQIMEMFRIHGRLPRKAARQRAVELLTRVGIPDARRRVDQYPHEFSGGMRQRAMIAMALALGPEVLIADEPTTALDVTIQAQIMDLLIELKQEAGMSLILITHDLALAAEAADRVAVMYAGRIVEQGSADSIFANPAHPYTLGLLESVPQGRARGEPLKPIPGGAPDLTALPAGCAFQNRCRFVTEACRESQPVLVDVGPDQQAACFNWKEVKRHEPLL